MGAGEGRKLARNEPANLFSSAAEEAMPARIEKRWIALLGVAVLLVAGAVWALHFQPGGTSRAVVGPANAKEEIAAVPEDASGPHKYANRLIHEKSPYLLMHAHNPVDWYPWGEEALAKARRADSDEGGRCFRFDAGHSFRRDAGRGRSEATLAPLSCLK